MVINKIPSTRVETKDGLREKDYETNLFLAESGSNTAPRSIRCDNSTTQNISTQASSRSSNRGSAISVEEHFTVMGLHLVYCDVPFAMPHVELGPKLTERGGDNIRKGLTSDGQLLAMKEVEVPGLKKDVDLANELGKEIEILRTTSHVNIVPYRYFSCSADLIWKKDTMECLVDKFKLRMYMDFIRHDTLETRYNEFQLSESQVGLYTRHILSGIDYLHNKNIVHRDIRCANIWIDDKGVCKLVNFGKAKELHDRKEEILSTSITENVRWMAPEIAKGSKYQKPVDIWSLGCTVLEMLNGRKPFEESEKEVTDVEVLARLKTGQGPTIPDTLSTTARNFLMRCLQQLPEKRSTAEDLLEDPFLNPSSPMSQLAAGSLPSREESGQVTTEYVENPAKAVQSQTREDCLDNGLSIEDMCCRISEELEKNEGDSTAFVISSDWLIKWQSDDDKVYTKLLDAGYLKTFETDTYACFESILGASNGDCSVDWPTPTDEILNNVVDSESKQESTRNTNSSRLPDNASTSESGSENRINTDNSGAKSGDDLEKSGEKNVLIVPQVNDLEVSGMASCTEQCPHIPLTLVRDGALSSCSRSRSEVSTVMIFTDGLKEVKVPLTLSCCVRGNQLCIKLKWLKGEIFSYPKGTVLRETRISVAAMVGGVNINLTPLDPGNDQTRVCSTGQAKWDCYLGKEGNFWFLRIAPSIQLAPFGGAQLGEFTVMKNRKPRHRICNKDDSLDLVTLKVGQAGCRLLEYKKVLVMNRHLVNTWLAGEGNDLTCVDSQANSRPIILEGKFDLDCSTRDDGTIQDQIDISLDRSIEITCCAKVEIDFIPEDKLSQKIKKEIFCVVTRNREEVSLCSSHVQFKGTIPLN